ncbi:aldehyde dehydrogenase family protein [Rhodococcus sp. WS3]|uniref:aldehyde dehydrogenase family protein n=1 Tax=Rhodococcus sp. WS3 TaxID=2486271 RepID=UPI00114213A9|nr:aldehyde dehydrogenase family protein [Rhodococcus sp. WS3]ROZ49001.1 aldehyde dehydrogenase family protein [Rhodococcus sp. WS3]
MTTTFTNTNRFFIGGDWVDPMNPSGEIEVLNPATEEVIAVVPEASAADAGRAVTAARKAFDHGPWPRMQPRERAKLLLRMAERMEARKAEILDLLVAEAGSPRRVVESLHWQTCFDHFVDLAERVVSGHQVVRGIPPVVGKGIGQGVVMDDPAGVATLITAFNFPFHLNLMKIGPALGAGCTAVLKPSELTPLSGLILGEIAAEAGLPDGVLNVVAGGPEAGRELTVNPGVDLVSFTGSGAVGKLIVRLGAETLKRVVLELGGKSASIVFADADLDAAARAVVSNMTLHSGQACILHTRTLVEKAVHDDLVERVVKLLREMRLGDPADPDTTMGPLISDMQRTRVLGYLDSGREQGGDIAFGGGVPAGLSRGFYVEPTLFTGCSNDMKISQEEIFGPVGVVIPFDGAEQAVTLANDTKFGLGAGVWSRDARKAYDIARQMRAGLVQVNGGMGGATPFGPYGGFKESGIGREFGEFGFREYLESKTIGWPAIAPW